MKPKVKGRVWKVGDNINTDLILPGPYLTLKDADQKAAHVLETVIPNFSDKVRKNDIIVAGRNFGGGSSREIAPLLLKRLGVGAVVAESFARIFFRNAVNIGLPVIECKDITDGVENGQELEIDLAEGRVRNLSKNEEYQGTKMPEFLMQIVAAGGALELLKQKKRGQGRR